MFVYAFNFVFKTQPNTGKDRDHEQPNILCHRVSQTNEFLSPHFSNGYFKNMQAAIKAYKIETRVNLVIGQSYEGHIRGTWLNGCRAPVNGRSFGADTSVRITVFKSKETSV